MLFDLQLAFRNLQRHRGLAVATVTLVAAGAAVNTVLFAAMDGLLFKPLPFPDADRLVIVRKDIPLPGSRAVSDHRKPFEIARECPGFDAAEGYSQGSYESTVKAYESGVSVAQVTPGFFALLGQAPLVGRTFAPDDAGVAGSGIPPALLGERLWRDRFGGDPSVLGRYVDIEGTRVLVVGIMPRRFDFPRGANVWRPLTPLQLPGGHRVDVSPTVIARLRAGVALADARALLASLRIERLRDDLRPREALSLAFLLAGTLLLLVATWVQVAALQLARATGRVQQIGLCLALGATPWRVVRQLSTEGALLGFLALSGAWLLTAPLLAFFVRALPVEMTMGQHIGADVRSLAFAAAISLLGVVAFAVMPAVVVRRVDVSSACNSWRIGQRRPMRMRRWLLVAQLATTAALLYGAALTLHSFARVSDVNLGFRSEGLLAVDLPRDDFSSVPDLSTFFVRQRARFEEATERIAALPGITAVTGTVGRPIGGMKTRVDVALPNDDRKVVGYGTFALPGALSTLGITMVQGRGFNVGTLNSDQNAVVVSRNTVRALGVSESILECTLLVSGQAHRVIGVAEDVRWLRPDALPEPHVYRLMGGSLAPSEIVVRVSRASPAVIAAVQAAVQDTWRTASKPRVDVLDEELRRANAPYRSRAMLLGLVALASLALSLIGVYSAVAYTTRQEMRAYAVRIALGASPQRIVGQVIAASVAAASIALSIGLTVGAVIGRSASSFLFEVSGTDWAATLTAIALVETVTGVAAFLPAIRTARLSPAVALRDE
jgi:predicted permease